MFLNRSTLRTSLQGLVGGYQTINPDYPSLIPSLLVSRSSRYWNDEHSLLTIENISNCFINYSHFSYTAYSGLTTYSLGNKVSSGGTNYEYINAVDSSGNAPPNATYWRAIDVLNDYLIQLDYKASDMTLDSVFNAKKLRGEVKSLFSNRQLFVGQAHKSDLVTNEGAMVGLRISLKDQRSLVSVLHKVGHQFNNTLTDIDLYLFHTSQETALTTFTFSHNAANSSQWTSLSDYVIRWLSDNHDIGGSFLLVYFQDDIGSVRAIEKDISWDNYKSCCDSKKDYKEYSQFARVTGLKVPSTYLNGTSLPDVDFISDNFSDYNSNYGLNLQFSAKCDLTPFVTQQEDLLAEVKSLNMAFLLLRDMAFNTRGSNSLANQVKQMAKAEIYSERGKGITGKVIDRLNSATKALDFDLSGLDEPCLCRKNTLMVDYDSV